MSEERAKVSEADFLSVFPELSRKMTELRRMLEELRSRHSRVRRFEADVLAPPEKRAFARAYNLLEVMSFAESGEEKLMLTANHELKWLFCIIGDEPCRVCGEEYAPVRFRASYVCECGFEFAAPKPFATRGEAEAWFSAVEERQRERGYGNLFCPFCIDRVIRRGNKAYVVYRKLRRKLSVEVNQYFAYPRVFLLVDVRCKSPACGWYRREWFPSDEGGRAVGMVGASRYEKLEELESCPLCGSPIERDEKKLRADEVTEDHRYTYDLPFRYEGKLVRVPPSAGVKDRYYFDFYELEEPYVVGRVALESALKERVAALLDQHEVYIYEKDVRASVLGQLRTLLVELEANVTRDRTRFVKLPHIVAVRAAPLREAVKLAAEVAGMLDVIIPAYIPELVWEHGHVVKRPLHVFKAQGLDVMRDILGRSVPRPDGEEEIQAPVGEFFGALHAMEVSLEQLRGVAEAYYNFILDRLGIRQREVDILRTSAMAAAELTGTATTEKGLATDRILLHLNVEHRKPHTVDELASELGIEKGTLNRLLTHLASRGRVRRVGRGLYEGVV